MSGLSNGAVFALTAVTLVFFASNSVFCRMALADARMGAIEFTVLRLVCGAGALQFLSRLGKRRLATFSLGARLRDGIFLAAYALLFSLAYRGLSAGMGALLLFVLVQITVLSGAVLSHASPPPWGWVGVGIAVAGLVYLLLPGLSAPPLGAALLMGGAGVAWGMYTLSGKRHTDAIAANTSAFTVAALLTAPLLVTSDAAAWPLHGIVLAVVSGALTSAMAYAIWYVALRGLSKPTAGAVQLLVPPIAAAGGVLFLGETVSLRLMLATLLISAGIGLLIWAQARRSVAAARGTG